MPAPNMVMLWGIRYRKDILTAVMSYSSLICVAAAAGNVRDPVTAAVCPATHVLQAITCRLHTTDDALRAAKLHLQPVAASEAVAQHF
jgi:hypothetical protein